MKTKYVKLFEEYSQELDNLRNQKIELDKVKLENQSKIDNIREDVDKIQVEIDELDKKITSTYNDNKTSLDNLDNKEGTDIKSEKNSRYSQEGIVGNDKAKIDTYYKDKEILDGKKKERQKLVDGIKDIQLVVDSTNQKITQIENKIENISK